MSDNFWSHWCLPNVHCAYKFRDNYLWLSSSRVLAIQVFRFGLESHFSGDSRRLLTNQQQDDFDRFCSAESASLPAAERLGDASRSPRTSDGARPEAVGSRPRDSVRRYKTPEDDSDGCPAASFSNDSTTTTDEDTAAVLTLCL